MDIEFAGLWAIVIAGGRKYIGKVEGLSKQNVLAALKNGTVLEINPAFDYETPTNFLRGPGGELTGSQKIPVVTPLDFTLAPTPFHAKPEAVIFFEDMQEGDADTYKALVRQAVAQAQQSRVTRSGLALPTSANGPRKFA